MASLLQQLDIFELRPLITNLSCKLSTISEYDARKQLLCLVSEDNDIVLRYTADGGQEVLKLITWFRRTNRVIHDVCFDPSGTWLLVLCFDNTLHIVPALAAVDKTFGDSSNASCPQQPFSTTQVTSYIIPFVGPHECPNSKKCPNHPTTATAAATAAAAASAAASTTAATTNKPKEDSPTTAAAAGENPSPLSTSAAEHQKHFDLEKDVQKLATVHRKDDNAAKKDPREKSKQPLQVGDEDDEDGIVVLTPLEEQQFPFSAVVEEFKDELPDSNNAASTSAAAAAAATVAGAEDKASSSNVMATSFMASNTCPYPLSVVWWQTIDGVHRAIIGYSDGSICFVGLSPNCPFVASTTIESGSVVKLLICKDITFESVMLLITSSLKQQFKLLLEQKAIKYIYPGDISPSTAQPRESDWQIIVPLKTNSSNCSDPASDSSQLEEDVFIKNDEQPSSSSSDVATSGAPLAIVVPASMLPPPPSSDRPRPPIVGPIGAHAGYICTSQLPPPPPYSVAINRHVDSAPLTTTAGSDGAGAVSVAGGGGVRYTQQQLYESDDFNARAGLLPAARARLASLKSLGSKKLNAIKMRLSDNRQKLEEYMPENTLGSFAIMDSPSLTPEVLGSSIGSFYTIQNLRNTYLLSALHCHSNSLSVHSIDINLKPLFLYKIPKNCFDILISSNILYSIQYVDAREHSFNTSSEEEESALVATAGNTDKENRDTDLEKQEKDAIVLPDINDIMPDPISGGESADTSATTSGSSTTQSSLSPSNSVNAVGVISSAMASLRTGDDDSFNNAAQLGLFRFDNETVLCLYQMANFRDNEPSEAISKEEKAKAFDCKTIRSTADYIQFYENVGAEEEYSLRQMEIMQSEFPKINYDPCYVVTNKNLYYIQLRREPFQIFLGAALRSKWQQCREFCNTFDLAYESCIEFAGDYLLRRGRVTQALLTYNTARIKPIRTALKLAMFGQTCALMHLCAMALKSTYLLKSEYFCHPIIKTLLPDITYRHSEDVRKILPPTCKSRVAVGVVNEGARCSDYTYGVDEVISNLQMSASSQFHLANLLLITLAEKAVIDKNYLPLWNFLVTNTKYHTNMTSIVLCQSGLFSAALVLAKIRGVCIDTFLALTSVVGQEFGWYTELNVCLYNLSEPMFAETITYLPHVSVDYFGFIQEKLENVRQCVLKRLEKQLDPFSATLRPIVSHTSSGPLEHHHNANDNNATYLFEFCKNLIETYLAVLIHMESQRSKREQITNALSTFRITYEDNQFAIETLRFKPISAGCAHCACVVDGVAYFWGSNGVPCNYSVSKSSDPPEPPHAVKSLELLSQLNLEVHAVKCGRQHTLVLTNNGLYAFGNNNLSQLGIGKHMQLSLQPMLLKAFDGKNITILEAGQYHNAAVADGLLYTWGWGVYGQLGHGDTENLAEPKLVSFFKYKKVIQVSLGHAHSLVLCQGGGQQGQSQTTELYVFGSNHFGQLGIGTTATAAAAVSGDSSNSSPDDEGNCAKETKSLLPLRLYICTTKIRLIHTKFFTNLAVDENERMYTWGSSPQALRMANQIKRRANAKQKIEEQQRREMSKRFEATMATSASSTDAAEASTSAAAAAAQTVENPLPPTATTITITDTEGRVTQQAGNEDAATPTPTTTTAAMASSDPPTASEDVVLTDAASLIDQIVRTATTEAGVSIQMPFADVVQTEKSSDNVALNKNESAKTAAAESTNDEKKTEKQASTETAPTDLCEHMSPQLVDTTEVAGKIMQVSSGLFHFALISSSCTLYTWGKNLEHQLGTNDKDRRAVSKPSPIDVIESPMYVDCGADFTVVMTTEFLVKAFGGNSNGQCGRDLGASLDKTKPRVICLPATKRVMRFETQCVEVPVEINLPRPRIRLDTDTVLYLKNIPRYQPHFVQEADINFDDAHFERPSPSSQQQQHYKSTTQADSSEQALTGQDSDDLISSLENLSNNDASSPNYTYNASTAERTGGVESGGCPLAAVAAAATASANQNSSYDSTPEEQSYAPLATTDNADQSCALPKSKDCGTAGPSVKLNAAAAAAAADTPTTLTSEHDETSADDAAELQALRQYIHYCLYVFHGLYNPDKVRDFAKGRLEYRIRTLMLNFKFIDAFKLCLQDCGTANKALKIFEYFTKDTGYVPMRRQDSRYLIYYLFLHFMARKFDLLECERFFLADLDFYLLELAYVLYFNNNNTLLEQNLNEKFKSLISSSSGGGSVGGAAQNAASGNGGGSGGGGNATDPNQSNEQEHKLEDTDVIFDSLSVKFKTIVCQRLMKHCNN